jgi:predicted RND superfamily exporter protein
LPKLQEDFSIETRQGGLVQQERDFLGDATTALILCLTGIYLCLSWIFASWTRPLVVMSVIPFGLIGAIWGHYIWEVPLSLFSIVGLIGMSGIIINDSIVLVSTIDEYSRKRGLIPAVVDAVADRLRPVLLTTLTTVLGLAPLLFERSSQAEFLKPTVVTLVFGLGFGMFLVLLVVPAITVVLNDGGRRVRALRRSLRGHGRRRGQMQRLVGGAALAVAVVLVAVMGPVLAGGALPAWLLAVLPGLGGLPVGLAAMLVVAGGAALVTGGVWLAARRRAA